MPGMHHKTKPTSFQVHPRNVVKVLQEKSIKELKGKLQSCTYFLICDLETRQLLLVLWVKDKFGDVTRPRLQITVIVRWVIGFITNVYTRGQCNRPAVRAVYSQHEPQVSE